MGLKIFFGALLTFAINLAIGQENFEMSSGLISTCDGVLFDSGGNGGSGYDNNEFFVLTICPEVPENIVSLEFVNFNLDLSESNGIIDHLDIYDGAVLQETLLGSFTGQDLNGLTIEGSTSNTSGCLTLLFETNSSGVGEFEAIISCNLPCVRPVAIVDSDIPEDMRICPGEVLNFDGSNSTSGDGALVDFLWDFGDGSISTDGLNVFHSWDIPGEYEIELTIVNSEDCANTNTIDLSVFVSTYPNWEPFPSDTVLCVGEELCLEAFPEEYSVAWEGPDEPFTNDDYIVLPDNLGSCAESTIMVEGFAAGQTLDAQSDLRFIGISIEHSWMYDLNIDVICPNGVELKTHNQMETSSGVDAIANGTDVGITDLAFLDYRWTDDAFLDSWSVEAETLQSEILPEGAYKPVYPISDLLNCQLNGLWKLRVCDMWGGDDGTLGGWSLKFDPEIFPDVQSFTPVVGLQADSSFWTIPDGFVGANVSDNGNIVCLTAQEPGLSEFKYEIINNHGCSFDTSITVSIHELDLEMGDDFSFCSEEIIFNPMVTGAPEPQCSDEAGDYTFCYNDNEDIIFTFCPDYPGDELTFMDITFSAGTVESFFDELWIYDGEDIFSDVIAGPITGDLTGISFVAENEMGCISMRLISNNSGSCADGAETLWEFNVGCSSNEPTYTWAWSPEIGLDDPTIWNPEVLTFDTAITYHLDVVMDQNAYCVATDSVSVLEPYSNSINYNDPECNSDVSSITVDVDTSTGDGPWDIFVYQNGQEVAYAQSQGETIVFDELEPNGYEVYITDGSCAHTDSAYIYDVPYVYLTLPNDTIYCLGDSLFLEAIPNDLDIEFDYVWSTGDSVQGIWVAPLVPTTFNVWAEYGDCVTETESILVSWVEPPEIVELEDIVICAGDPVLLDVVYADGEVHPFEIEWYANGELFAATDSIVANPTVPTEFCYQFMDVCQSTIFSDCFFVDMGQFINPVFSADTLGGCWPMPIHFYLDGNINYVESVHWEFGDGVGSNSIMAHHVYQEQGVYDVSLVIVSDDGCVFEHYEEDFIQIFNQPASIFAAEPQIAFIPHTTFEFSNYSLGNDYNHWDFGGLGESYHTNQDFQFPQYEVGTYPITLEVWNEWGCRDTSLQYVIVEEDFAMYIPNTFTPNFDGKNDFFNVKGTDIDPENFKMQIFSEWGELIFETSDYQIGWDGSYGDLGEIAPEGIYVYRITAYSTSTFARREHVGHIYLMK